MKPDFFAELRAQRWDDHRYYHHCRINQSLHFVSALAFLCAYALLFIEPALAGLLGWLVAMVARQSGHFFFEPKGYDAVNHATHEEKESIKLGYNLRRKVFLHLAWAATPLLLWAVPDLFGLVEPATGAEAFARNLGLLWLWLGAAGLAVRAVQLSRMRDARTALVWVIKILTDPFHDARLYWRAPLQLIRGERFAPVSTGP
jgi:hypothetical protein